MAKSVEEVSRALKLKAQPASNALQIRIGQKRPSLPFEVRTIVGKEYVFVHIPPSAGILRITDDGLVPVESPEEAATAAASFRQSRKRGKKAPASVDMPPELEAALSKIPSGYKLAYQPDGAPRLVKMRKRTK